MAGWDEQQLRGGTTPCWGSGRLRRRWATVRLARILKARGLPHSSAAGARDDESLSSGARPPSSAAGVDAPPTNAAAAASLAGGQGCADFPRLRSRVGKEALGLAHVARREGSWTAACAKLKAAAAMGGDGGSVREARTADPPPGGLGRRSPIGSCRCSIQTARGSRPGRRPCSRPAGSQLAHRPRSWKGVAWGVGPARLHGGVSARMNGGRVGFTAARAANSRCGQVADGCTVSPVDGTDSSCVRLATSASASTGR
jgi:hypothetical protein